MHEVLDGEASADDTRQLEQLLSADPGARSEFEKLRRFFSGLNAIPKAGLSQDLLDDMLAKLPRQQTRRYRLRQLSSRWRVFIADSRRRRGASANRASRTKHVFVEPNIRNAEMSEPIGGLSSKRKLWIGAGVAAVALVVAARYFNLPPSHDMSGTIAPANRSVAEQPGAADVNGTDQAGAQSVAVTGDAADRNAASDMKDRNAASDMKDRNAASDMKDRNAASDMKDRNAASDMKDRNAASDMKDRNAASDMKDRNAASDAVAHANSN
jgi:hypothetical protein